MSTFTRRFLTIRNAWLLGAGLLSLLATVHSLRDTDVWWHIAIGRYISGHGIPSQEPFAFTAAAQPWSGHEWLYELLLAKVVGVSPILAALFMGALGSAALIIAANSVPRHVHVAGGWLAAALLLTGFGTAELFGVRAQVVTVAGTAVVMWVLTRWRSGDQRPLWLLPPLLLVWCNLHGGFVTAFALLILAAALPHRSGFGIVGSRRPLLIATGVALLVTLIRPTGWNLYGYIADTISNPGNITEWQSPNFHDPWLRLFELSAILLVVAWTLTPKGPDFFDVVFAGGALVASLQAQRNISIYAVIATPQLARYGQAAWHEHRSRIPRLGNATPLPPRLLAATAVPLLLVIAAAVSFDLTPMLSQLGDGTFEAQAFPKTASDYVISHFPGQRIYSSYEYGGYLAYRMPEGRVVLIYGEAEVFGDAGLQQYLDVHLLRSNWADRLQSFGSRHAILAAGAQEIGAFSEIGWRTDCYDRGSDTVVMSETAKLPAIGELPTSPTQAPAC